MITVTVEQHELIRKILSKDIAKYDMFREMYTQMGGDKRPFLTLSELARIIDGEPYQPPFMVGDIVANVRSHELCTVKSLVPFILTGFTEKAKKQGWQGYPENFYLVARDCDRRDK